jgi:hypothetical protein
MPLKSQKQIVMRGMFFTEKAARAFAKFRLHGETL